MEKYFEEKNVIINPVLNKLFILYFYNENNFDNKDKLSKEKKIIFSDDIFGTIRTDKINLINFKDISNFINYYFETKDLDFHDVINYPLYNPLTDGTDFYITIIEREKEKKNLMIICVDPVYEFKDLEPIYDEDYKYILIVYKTHYFNVENSVLVNISNFFFKELDYSIIEVQDDEKIIYENNSKYIKLYEEKAKAFILDKKEQRIQSRFKAIIEGKNIKIDKKSIIDKNILNIIKSMPNFPKGQKINILIDEPFNIIYTYLNSIYKNANFVLLNDENNNEIKEFISTREKNEIKNVNIFSYFFSNKEKYFNVIILENNCFPDHQNHIIPKTLFDGPKLKNIRDHLIDGGIFCFHLILKNKYLKEKIKTKLRIFFNNVDILNNYELDNIVICS